MSRLFFCPFLLLGIFFFCAVLGGERVHKSWGEYTFIGSENSPGIVEECEATHIDTDLNKTHELIIFKDGYEPCSIDNDEIDGIDPHDNRKVVGYNWEGSCVVLICHLEEAHRGKWIITTYYKSNETDETKKSEEIIHLYLDKKSVNERYYLNARKGQYVIAHGVEDVGNGTCIFSIERDGEDIFYDLSAPTDKSEGIKRLGANCDVEIVVDARTEGVWRIIQESDDYYVRKTSFRIGIYEDNRPQKEIWYQGSAAKMNLSPRYANDFCELILPDESSIQLESPICNYTVPHVTKEHAGLWTARYRLENSGEFVEEYFQIKILDPPQVIIDVNKDEKSSNISCSIESIHVIRECTFMKPNKDIINGSIAYRKARKCDSSIQNWSESDYGEWKCIIEYDNGLVTSALINVKREIEIADQGSIVRKYGDVNLRDEIEINCVDGSSGAEFDYCHIRSPNNQLIHSITSYVRKLDGKCKMIIGDVNQSHQGNWTCQHGLRGENISPVSVTSVVITDPPDISITAKHLKDTVSVTCEVFKKEFLKGICEFSSPSGAIIDRENTLYYHYEDHLWCGISFDPSRKDIAPYKTWTCSVKNRNASIKVSVTHPPEVEGNWGFRSENDSRKDLYVQRGKSFQVTCNIKSEFDYWRLLPPNDEVSSAPRIRTRSITPNTTFYQWGKTIAHADDKSAGEWTCEYGSYGDSKTSKTVISVKVMETSMMSRVSHYPQGYDMALICNRFPDAEWRISRCNWIGPNGQKIDESRQGQYKIDHFHNSCSLSFYYLYKQQIGNWTCEAIRDDDGKRDDDDNDKTIVELDETFVKVQIREIETSVTKIDGSVQFTCKLPIDESPRECQFTDPLGVEVDIGSRMRKYIDGYSRYIDIYKGRCILKIEKPRVNDLGIWQCMMKYDGIKIRKAINFTIDVKNIEHDLRERSAKGNISVRHKMSFKLKCKIETSIDYCEIKTPNGKIHIMENSATNPERQKSLNAGSCSAIVKSSNRIHNGDWTCKMGIQGNSHVESTIRVTVKESHLIPTITNAVDPDKTDKNILQCKASSIGRERIDYCRWVHPDGHEISMEDESRLLMTQNAAVCSIELTSWSEDDFGEWKCFAFLDDQPDKERHAIVEFGKRREKFLHASTQYYLIGSISLVVLIILVLICYLFIRRK